MQDFLAAIGLVLVVEGLVYGGFPGLAKLVDGAPDVEMRVFLRDANPDVMDQYLKRGLYRTIPVIVFFDEQMNELARYMERQDVVTELRTLLKV